MPHFSTCRKTENCRYADTWICQLCGNIYCGGCVDSQWRPDLTGHESAGNVCPACLSKATPPAQGPVRFQDEAIAQREEGPMSLYEHCKRESGLEGAALNRYIQRYYGHN